MYSKSASRKCKIRFISVCWCVHACFRHWWENKLAVVLHQLDVVELDVIAGEDALEGLEGLLGQGLATGVDVGEQVASELLGLGVESGPAGDGQGVGVVVSGDDGLLVHGCNKENTKFYNAFYIIAIQNNQNFVN